MATPAEMAIDDLIEAYSTKDVSNSYLRIYEQDRFGRIFAFIHEQLNGHFASINDRARSSRHYWADSSRELIGLIEDIADVLDALSHGGIAVTFSPEYRRALDRCTPWLQTAYGSEVPEEFAPIQVTKYAPIFTRPEAEISLVKHSTPRQLKLVGEGSYASEYSFEDPDYGIRFALKRAKKGLAERDIARFANEFQILKSLSFPYIVEVYKYNDDRVEYTMEFCEDTLRSFIARKNAKLRMEARKRIALQFLYGMNYIHFKGLLHRDISPQNVLLRVFNDGAVIVKLSDFGLTKDSRTQVTRTQSEIRGTIIDPMLESFKAYEVRNEIFAIGHVLSYIFTGKEAPQTRDDRFGKIVRQCVSPDIDERYPTVAAIISDVELIPVSPSDATA